MGHGAPAGHTALTQSPSGVTTGETQYIYIPFSMYIYYYNTYIYIYICIQLDNATRAVQRAGDCIREWTKETARQTDAIRMTDLRAALNKREWHIVHSLSRQFSKTGIGAKTRPMMAINSAALTRAEWTEAVVLNGTETDRPARPIDVEEQKQLLRDNFTSPSFKLAKRLLSPLYQTVSACPPPFI